MFASASVGGNKYGKCPRTILPLAIGVAISPVPIIAVILMLFSQRARSNGTAFLVCWVLALVVVGSIVLILANVGKISAGGAPSTLAYVLKLLLGLLYILMSIRQCIGRRSSVVLPVCRPVGGKDPQQLEGVVGR